jgi:hypothetical protein
MHLSTRTQRRLFASARTGIGSAFLHSASLRFTARSEYGGRDPSEKVTAVRVTAVRGGAGQW